MPVSTLFATRVYTKSLKRGRSDPLNARLLRECRQLAEDDGAGMQWSATNYPGGYTSYNSLARMHRMSPTFAALEKRIDTHVRAEGVEIAVADAGPGLERAIKSLLEHKAYIEVLTDQDPEEYVRSFLTGNVEQAATRFGGRPAVPFEVFPR